jgi:hypothetical protein
MRTDAQHAVDAANDATSSSANKPANEATDRSERAITGIRTAVSPVMHPPRHALRLRGRRKRKKEDGTDYAKDFHVETLVYVTPSRA